MIIDIQLIQDAIKEKKLDGITYRTMAERTGVSVGYINNVIYDRYDYTYVEKFINLIEFLELDVRSVFKEEQ